MRACFLGQNICVLGSGVAILQSPPVVLEEPPKELLVLPQHKARPATDHSVTEKVDFRGASRSVHRSKTRELGPNPVDVGHDGQGHVTGRQ